MGAGRPRTTTNDFPKDWQKLVISLMSEGASQKEIMTELGIGSQLFYDLLERDEEFSNTIKRGIEISEAWWERQGRINLNNKSFNAVLWYMNMRNRFNWKDRNSTDITTKDQPLSIQVVSYHDVLASE